MATAERYDRQTRIVGWDQTKLDKSTAFVIGSEKLSDFLLVDLAALGIGRIFRIGQSNLFPFSELNPEIFLEQTGEEILTSQEADRIISSENPSTVVIDCTNNPKSKFFSSIAAKLKGLKYFSASAGQNSFSFSSEQAGESLFEYHKESGQPQGPINSMICSAILADELRKYLMPLKTDLVLSEYEREMQEPGRLERKIIQVGAGATGTFTGFALSTLGADLILVDYDTVEKTNLNRQFLFYDSIGLNKANALAEKIRRYGSGKIGFLEKKIAENFRIKNFDFIFSCVDNNDARIYMEEASAQSGIPLVNCGSSIEGCSACVYTPKKTACLTCQTGLKSTKQEVKKRAIGDCFNPSLIITNQIAGALAVKVAYDTSRGLYLSQEYHSGLGIDTQQINDLCFKNCRRNG